MENISVLTLHRIATYIFCDACENTTNGSWSVDINELERIFNVVITKSVYMRICQFLRNDFSLQILDLNENEDDWYFDNYKEFNINIGGYYAIYGDDDYEQEEENDL
jgi:hypothetical protein